MIYSRINYAHVKTLQKKVEENPGNIPSGQWNPIGQSTCVIVFDPTGQWYPALHFPVGSLFPSESQK